MTAQAKVFHGSFFDFLLHTNPDLNSNGRLDWVHRAAEQRQKKEDAENLTKALGKLDHALETRLATAKEKVIVEPFETRKERRARMALINKLAKMCIRQNANAETIRAEITVILGETENELIESVVSAVTKRMRSIEAQKKQSANAQKVKEAKAKK